MQGTSVSVLCAKGREQTDHRALLPDLPLVQLVCLGLVQAAEGLTAVQAEPEELRLPESAFTKRPVPLPDLSNERIFPGGIHVKALFDAGCKWRLVEEFGAACFQEQPEG